MTRTFERVIRKFNADIIADKIMAHEKALLLRDDPLTNLEHEDRFRHKAYQETLRRIVEEVDPPFIVGLYGRWGTGKSTIARQLRQNYAKQLNRRRTSRLL